LQNIYRSKLELPCGGGDNTKKKKFDFIREAVPFSMKRLTDIRSIDFFRCLSGIVTDAVREAADIVLIVGDFFHTGQILPKTFAKIIENLQPMKEAGIPCIAIEGNHDWIHQRHNISWMEAISEMGYIRLMRLART